jgi:hypothetical protein
MLLNMADVGQLHNIGTVLHSAFRPKEAAQFGIGAEVAVRAAREGAERIMAQGRFNLANALSRYAQATMKYTLLDAGLMRPGAPDKPACAGIRGMVTPTVGQVR